MSPPVCAARVPLIARGCLIGATPRGAAVAVCSDTLTQGQRAESTADDGVVYVFASPSLCCHVHRELMRSALLDLILIIPAAACHQRNYVERYSRCIEGSRILHHGSPA